MELVVHRDRSGAIALVEMVVARFCTSLLARVPPNDFHMAIWYGARVKRYRRGGWAAMSEEELGHVRYDIQSMIHPCVSMNGDLAWGNHDHAGHASCFSSNPLIFIFSNKDAAMRDLRSLGCDLEKEYVQCPSRAIEAAAADDFLASGLATSMTYVSSTSLTCTDVTSTAERLQLGVNLP